MIGRRDEEGKRTDCSEANITLLCYDRKVGNNSNKSAEAKILALIILAA